MCVCSVHKSLSVTADESTVSSVFSSQCKLVETEFYGLLTYFSFCFKRYMQSP